MSGIILITQHVTTCRLCDISVMIVYVHNVQDIPDYELSWRIEPQKPGHCASLIYTSGTTGPPKVCVYVDMSICACVFECVHMFWHF